MSTQRSSDNIAKTNQTKRNTLKSNQEELNPCYKEHLLSLKCLNSAQNQQNACEIYFINYKNCKKFWSTIQYERRSKGIKPYLPPLHEREKIKADYFKS